MTPERIAEMKRIAQMRRCIGLDFPVGAIRELFDHIESLTAELAEVRRETVGECIGICERVSKDCIGEGVVYHYESAMTCAVELRALIAQPAPRTGACVWGLNGRDIHGTAYYLTSCGHIRTGGTTPPSGKCTCGKPIRVAGEGDKCFAPTT